MNWLINKIKHFHFHNWKLKEHWYLDSGMIADMKCIKCGKIQMKRAFKIPTVREEDFFQKMPKLKYNPYKDIVTLDDQLRDILKTKFNLVSLPALLTEENLDYIEGLKDAGITDASKLIVAINQHKKVELYIE